jgi:hypothetical protein
MYSLACTFKNTLGAELGENADSFIKSYGKKFAKIGTVDKMHYTKYSLKLAEAFSEQMGTIKEFEMNVDPESDIIHDFSLRPKKGETRYVVMSHKSINVRDIIPEKFPKICKYKKNTNISKGYVAGYEKINEHAGKKISSKEKYNEISDKVKQSAIYGPICELVIDSFSKKRKCAPYFYRHVFDESNRIILKLYKNRFTMYDFGTDVGEAESFKMKLTDHNQITVTFSNKAKFVMTLKTNASEIKERLSVKFHVDFANMDELFAITNKTI